MIRLLTGLVLCLASARWSLAFELPASSTQCVVGVAGDWKDSHARLQCYQKRGNIWKPVGSAIPARLGRHGLAWGLGIHPVPASATLKREGDGKAPAGIFFLGGAWGYAREITRHADLPYRTVTARDLWIEDPKHPHYNSHLLLSHEPTTPWEKKQQMRQNDPAHALKLFIAHNAAPHARPGMGSSIFFHRWRAEGSQPSAGCTTMSLTHLQSLIAAIDPTQQPLYILLPRAEYRIFQTAWKLPPLANPSTAKGP
jgi:L,D-peptidoglycan transpeptidase YkuD (ErfK/YbiS/YcfS/YnhG family)